MRAKKGWKFKATKAIKTCNKNMICCKQNKLETNLKLVRFN